MIHHRLILALISSCMLTYGIARPIHERKNHTDVASLLREQQPKITKEEKEFIKDVKMEYIRKDHSSSNKKHVTKGSSSSSTKNNNGNNIDHLVNIVKQRHIPNNSTNSKKKVVDESSQEAKRIQSKLVTEEKIIGELHHRFVSSKMSAKASTGKKAHQKIKNILHEYEQKLRTRAIEREMNNNLIDIPVTKKIIRDPSMKLRHMKFENEQYLENLKGKDLRKEMKENLRELMHSDDGKVQSLYEELRQVEHSYSRYMGKMEATQKKVGVFLNMLDKKEEITDLKKSVNQLEKRFHQYKEEIEKAQNDFNKLLERLKPEKNPDTKKLYKYGNDDKYQIDDNYVAEQKRHIELLSTSEMKQLKRRLVKSAI